MPFSMESQEDFSQMNRDLFGSDRGCGGKDKKSGPSGSCFFHGNVLGYGCRLFDDRTCACDNDYEKSGDQY